MRSIFFTSLVILLSAHIVLAQNARVHRYTTPLAGQAVLRDADDKYNARILNAEMPDPDKDEASGELDSVKKLIQKAFPRKEQKAAYKTTNAAMPIVASGFVADSLGGIPSDNYVAVNNNGQAVSVINETIAIHNASTGQMINRKSLLSFSAAVGLNYGITTSYNYRYDPKVIYDPEADKFICVMLNGINQYNYIVLGFSQTNDPTGKWNFYKIYGDPNHDTTAFDYPAIAITHDEFFLTGNRIIDTLTWQTGFKESIIYQIRKQDGYNGDSLLTYQLWDSITYNGTRIRNLYPVKGGGSIKGPSQYLLGKRILEVQNDSFFLVQIPDTIGSANNNLVVTPLVSNLSYGVPPDGLQPDTSAVLMTNDDRILGGFAEGNEIQFVSASVDTANGASAVYHGIISNYTTTPTLTGHMFSIDSLDFGFPNLSFAGNKYTIGQSGSNPSIISFNFTGAKTFPGMGALFFDGSNYSNMLIVKTGNKSIKQLTGKEQRWGDYSGSQPQWNDMESVWIEGIFGHIDGNYGNYMARLLSPNYTGVPQTAAAPVQQSVLYPNPSWQFVQLKFEIEEEQMVNFVIYNTQGRMVDKLLSHFCQEGTNTVQFNVAPLPVGTYFLKATDAKGKVLSTHSFVRQ